MDNATKGRMLREQDQWKKEAAASEWAHRSKHHEEWDAWLVSRLTWLVMTSALIAYTVVAWRSGELDLIGILALVFLGLPISLLAALALMAALTVSLRVLRSLSDSFALLRPLGSTERMPDQ